MIKNYFFINTVIIILLFKSYSFAGISIPTPSTTLNQIANSLSHSATNIENIESINVQTSSIINSSDLKKNIKADAEKFNLKIDASAAEILASMTSTDSDSISAALSQMESNISELADDYVPTLDQDTIVYDTGWVTLTKKTSYDSKTYSSDNQVFDSSATQQMRGKVYVNFKKREVSADMSAKITLVHDGNGEKRYDWNTGAATFNSVPVVAESVKRLMTSEGETAADMYNGINDTMLASNTTLQASEDKTRQQLINIYNHDIAEPICMWSCVEVASEHGVFHYGKFTTATSESTGLGTLILEGGHAIQGSTEAQFAATVERLEGSGEITGTAYEGD